MWELSSGQTVRTLEGHIEQVSAVAVTPDGKKAISASWDQTLRVWDLSSGQLIARFDADDTLIADTVAPDGVTIVAGEETDRVYFMRLEGVRGGDRRNAPVFGISWR